MLGDAITGLALGFALLALRANPVTSILLSIVSAASQVALTVGLIVENWDKFVFALRNNLLGDIPIFGGLFSAVRNAIALIETAQTRWADFLEFVTGTRPAQPGIGARPPAQQPGSFEHFPTTSPPSAQLPQLLPRPPLGGIEFPSSQGLPASVLEAIARGGGTITPFQHGGIATRPTLALLGERSPEAVVPLGRGGWAPTINVYVSGNVTRSEQELAEVVADQIVRRMRGATAGGPVGSPTSIGNFY